jgi:DnaK suppressor protein
MADNRSKLYAECKARLLKAKEDHLHAFEAYRGALSEAVNHGDDGDVANAAEEQDITVHRREHLLTLLREIESALQRIESGTYGICEETGEPIEKDRLLAIPWTRLSLEGALTRERDEQRMRETEPRRRRAG